MPARLRDTTIRLGGQPGAILASYAPPRAPQPHWVPSLLRTQGQRQHVGECPCAVEHQVELSGCHPAEDGSHGGPKLAPHFPLQGPEAEEHGEAQDSPDCGTGRGTAVSA